jgi:hypothetical protein
LKIEQQLDEDIAWLCRQLELENAELPNNTVQKQLLAIKEKCFVRDGILLYTYGEEEEKRELVVLPSQLVDEVIGNMHNAVYSGHLGVNKTWEKVKERFYRPGLATAVKEYIKYCMICQTVKVNMTPRVARLKYITACFPNQLVTMDATSDLPMTVRGNKYIIVVVDHFSKYLEVYAVPNTQAGEVAKKVVNE